MKVNLNYIVAILFVLSCGCAGKISSSRPKSAAGKREKLSYSLLQGTINDKVTLRLAAGKATPFNWTYHLIDSTGISIEWDNDKVNTDVFPVARFRISTATDVREPCLLEINLTQSGEKLGELDIKYATYLQVYELILDNGQLKKILEQGLTIRQIKGKQPQAIFGSNDVSIPDVYKPHILVSNGAPHGMNEVTNTLLNRNMYQPFGWMEGVVMDGLQVLSASEAVANKSLQNRFIQYFTDTSFSYIGLNNTPVNNRVMNVETTLPFALYARFHPQHPAIETALEFCKQHQDKNGVISDDPQSAFPTIKTEECYTVSYPLAVIGANRQDKELQNIAVTNLLARAAALADSTGIYQRTNNKGGREYRNWSRGVAWYLLGFIRSWQQLKNHPDADKIKAEFVRAAAYVLQFQQTDGMWYCFMHEPETGIETSGTAGIAAALKYAYQLGVLDVKASTAATKATAALMSFITPDGLLTGTAQVNKGGEALQRSGYRVISPYTLGFMAYLMSPRKSGKI